MMPSLGSDTTAVDATHLCDILRGLRPTEATPVVLDCRDESSFTMNHIRGAVHVALPSLLVRRLAAGKASIGQVAKHLGAEVHTGVLLYDHEGDPTPVVVALANRMLQEGCPVHYLQGGFNSFQAQYPEWCEGSASCNTAVNLHAVVTAATNTQSNTVSSSTTNKGNDPPIVGLKSLRISTLDPLRALDGGVDPSGASLGPCDSSLGRETPYDDLCFPVEILPHLFLGNAKNSGDMDSLNRHKIQYIVNVTPNLPNVFEACGHYKYMQIPISDHWSQNLASFFPKAIQFIDEARESGVGVLVHCLAGISRSVTITVAYLMFKEKLSLEAAYEYVRVKKANIAPNFNFMGQLQDFQMQLNLSPHKCSCLSDCRCRRLHFLTSPDSGIEFDRYS